MSEKAQQLLQEALSLPEEERAGLATELLESLGPRPPETERDDAAWLAEIERRAREALAGKPGLSWEEVKAQVRGGLRSR